MEEYYLLVRPGDCQELLPPPGRDVGHVETQHEGQRNQIQECIKIFHDHLKQAGTGKEEKKFRQQKQNLRKKYSAAKFKKKFGTNKYM